MRAASLALLLVLVAPLAIAGHAEEYRFLTPSWWSLDCPMEPNELGYYEGGACLTVRPGETRMFVSVVDDLQGLVPAFYHVYVGQVSYQSGAFCGPRTVDLWPGATHVEIQVSAVSGPLLHGCPYEAPGIVGTIRGVFT